MKIGWNDFNRFKARDTEMIGDPACGAFDVGLVLAFGADAGDAQELAKLGEMLVTATFDKFSKVHKKPFAGINPFE